MNELDLYCKIEPLIGFYNEYEKLYEIYLDFIERDEVSTILDVGCGNGNFLTHLKDYEARGIDISRQMVKICRDKNLNVECKKIEDVEDSFSMIVAIGDVLNYMDRDNLKFFLSNIPKKLDKAGYFICDINTPYGFQEVASGVMISDEETKYLSVEADFLDGELISNFVFFEKEKECYKKHRWSIKQYAHEVSDIAQNLNMKFVKVVDINLFSDEFPDKSLIVFRKK